MNTMTYPTLNEIELATPELCCDFFQKLPFPATQYELTLYFQMLQRVSNIFERTIEEGYEFLLKAAPEAPIPDTINTRFELCNQAMQYALLKLEVAKQMSEAVAKLTALMNEQLVNLNKERENCQKHPKTPLMPGTDNVFILRGKK